MGRRDVIPGDRLIPGRLWGDPRFAGLAPWQAWTLLLLYAVCDLDGVAPAPPTSGDDRWDGLLASGLVAFYRDEAPPLVGGAQDDGPWAWLPEAPSWFPAGGPLRPPRRDDWPAPPPRVVAAALRLRLGREPTEAECREACPRAYGRRRPAAGADGPGDAAVREVFEAWRTCQAHPERYTLTGTARKLVRAALRECPADRLVAVVRWAHQADDDRARYLRGENQQRQAYTDLEPLLRPDKLQGRERMAAEWEAAGRPTGTTGAGGSDGMGQGTSRPVGAGAPHGIAAQVAWASRPRGGGPA